MSKFEFLFIFQKISPPLYKSHKDIITNIVILYIKMYKLYILINLYSKVYELLIKLMIKKTFIIENNFIIRYNKKDTEF